MAEQSMFEDLVGRVAAMGLAPAAGEDTPTTNVARPVHRGSWTGPFAPARARAATDNVEMEDVSGWHPANAPQLPAHPRYKGDSMQDRRKFMLEYESYLHALSAFETPHGKPFVMPVAACVETETMKLIAEYEMEKPLDSITKQDWISYFLIARHADMHRILTVHNLNVVLPQKEPKKLVRFMVDALEPPDFRASVRERLENEANKSYKTSPVKFAKWLVPLLRGYLSWHPTRKYAHGHEKPPPPNDKAGMVMVVAVTGIAIVVATVTAIQPTVNRGVVTLEISKSHQRRVDLGTRRAVREARA